LQGKERKKYAGSQTPSIIEGKGVRRCLHHGCKAQLLVWQRSYMVARGLPRKAKNPCKASQPFWTPLCLQIFSPLSSSSVCWEYQHQAHQPNFVAAGQHVNLQAKGPCRASTAVARSVFLLAAHTKITCYMGNYLGLQAWSILLVFIKNTQIRANYNPYTPQKPSCICCAQDPNTTNNSYCLE